MKKLLSLVLALVMVVGVIAPATVNAVEDSSQQVIRGLLDRYNKVKSHKAEIQILINMMIEKNFIDRLYTEAQTILDNGNYSELKSHLRDNVKISRENVNEIKSFVETWVNKEKINTLISELDSGNIKQPSKDYINQLISGVNAKLPESWNSDVLSSGSKLDLVLTLFDETMKALTVNEKTANGDFAFTVNTATIESELNNFLKGEAKFMSELKLSDAINKIVKNLEAPFNNAKPGSVNGMVGDIITKLGGTYIPYVAPPVDPSTPPSGGGGGGGGGGSSSGTAPAPTTPQANIEVPADTKAPATATVGKESVTITTSASGTTTIKVKETETIKIVEDLRKAAGKDREAAIVINLDTIKNLDLVLELPGKLIEALVKNNVNLEIKTANSEVAIPASTLAGITIPSGAKLELRVAEVPKTEVSQSTPESSDIKKVVDLNLVLVKGTEETKITTFRTYITVKLDVKGLGNEDKLAVYYLNEETNTLKFVTGKIENNKAVLRLKHFSKYVILESKLTFEDIKGHWSKLFVESMAAKNVIGGYGDGTFRPEGEITRAEFAKMIVDALELDLVKYDGRFTDVKATDWHSSYVATMVKSGLAGGYGDNTFKPNDKITRAEMAMILGNTLDMEVKSTEVDGLLNQFKDSTSIQEWSKLGIAKAVKAEIMVGSNNNFNPNGTATRGEAATAVYRLYNK